MSLSSRTTDALTRLGSEFKSVRSAIAQKYTKPIGGIPLTDLSAQVQQGVSPLAPPGAPGTNVLGGVKNHTNSMPVAPSDPNYDLSTAHIDSNGVITSYITSMLYGVLKGLVDGNDGLGVPPTEEQRLSPNAYRLNERKAFKAGLRWEQELLVMSGVREVGYGGVPMGLYVPHAVRIKGIRYEFFTASTGGISQGVLMVDYTSKAPGNMTINANQTKHIITGIDILVPAGSRIAFGLNSIGSGTIGEGLTMALWGEYDLDGITP